MGSEAICRVRFGGQVAQGKALLETTELLFRGDPRLKIPFSEMASVRAESGELIVEFGGATAVFELGKAAQTWAEKIRNPRGRLDKLGVKPGARVSVLDVDDPDLLDELRSRTDAISEGTADPGSDIILYGAAALDDLIRLPELRDAIDPKGAIWVVSPKGKGALLKDTEVMAAARDAGLVDTKVAAFSATHTALKLVIPVKLRSLA